MAGTVLLARLGSGNALPSGEKSRDSLFEYFMAEVMKKADTETLEFLYKTSLFPEFTEAMADEIAGKIVGEKAGGARALIGSLARKNFFIERYSGNPVKYRYHQLFREFLEAHVQEYFGPEKSAGLFASAAGLLADAGDMPAAFRLFIRAAQP